MDQAWQLAGSGHQAEAMQVLRQILTQSPNDADARLLLGSLLSEAGQHQEAIGELKQAVRLRPRSAEAEVALGEAYSSSGDRPAAQRSFQQAVTLDAKSSVAHLDLARVLIESEQFDAATAHLDRALSTLGQDSDAANAHYLRAKVYSAHNDAGQAASQLRQAIAIQPAFPEAWSDLGEACQTLQDHAGALNALTRAVELAPNGGVAQYRLGKEYLLQHQSHQAVKPLQEADRLNPDDQSTLNALQKALRQDGQTEAADRVKQHLADLLGHGEVTAEDELAAIQLNNQGAELQRAGDMRQAVEKYRAAVRLNPRSAPMRVNYAVALLRVGEWTAGLAALRESLRLDPGNSKIKAALDDALAQAPKTAGRP